MPQIYGGSGNISKSAQKIYVGVNDLSKEVQKMYVGVNGQSVLVYPTAAPDTFLMHFVVDQTATSFEIVRG